MGNTVGGVGVLDKAVDVLAALEVQPRSLSELVVATGLPRATAHRLATALEQHGLVRRDDDGRFILDDGKDSDDEEKDSTSIIVVPTRSSRDIDIMMSGEATRGV